MAIRPGTRLGPYEVAALVGEGGMGQVYRATDTNLKRAVAIKVLPVAFAGDGGRLARFQREAEVLARLDHPNIAQIHGLEKSDGAAAIVMEFVEGRRWRKPSHAGGPAERLRACPSTKRSRSPSRLPRRLTPLTCRASSIAI